MIYMQADEVLDSARKQLEVAVIQGPDDNKEILVFLKLRKAWDVVHMSFPRESVGTSVRRSSRSSFGRLTGNDVSGHYKRHYFLFFFLFLFFFFLFFSSPSSTFLIEGVLGSKNLFSES